MLSFSMNIWDALILSKHIVKEKQQNPPPTPIKLFKHGVKETCRNVNQTAQIFRIRS